MRVLACEPFYAGSHRQFLDGWSERSAHDFHLLTLPARWWKWRMRHAAIDFAERARKLADAGESFDLVLSTSMVHVAELRGLLPPELSRLPHVQYMHENQLTYPSSGHGDASRDLHLAMAQLTSALASDALWFNSEFHRRDFQASVPRFLEAMPEPLPIDPVRRLAERSSTCWPGVEDQRPVVAAEPGPLRIGWVARWEHDKNPELFFAALAELAERCDFRVSVLGERFREAPDCFEQYRATHPQTIDHWGFLERREEYLAALDRLDVVVSTARHEFFGLAVVEAMLAGALPLLPSRLSYPELLEGCDAAAPWGLYDGSRAELVSRLEQLCGAKRRGALVRGSARAAAARFGWSRRVPHLDRALCSVLAELRSISPWRAPV